MCPAVPDITVSLCHSTHLPITMSGRQNRHHLSSPVSQTEADTMSRAQLTDRYVNDIGDRGLLPEPDSVISAVIGNVI